ncbi:MAG: VanZ family protein [Candidatus Bipolaricaulia bacterium]
MRRGYWGISLIIYAALIFWLSSRPFPEGPPLFHFDYGDKLWHLLEYLLFGFLAWKAFLPRSRGGLALALFISLGYAGSDELHQWFVPTRAASLLDWGADALGVIGGLLLGRLGEGLHS